ncbi:MAG: glycoside hydrolase family 15 protein [Woeseia sp.]
MATELTAAVQDSSRRAKRCVEVPAPDIRDLGLIGDRRTAAVVSPEGSILWYCPGRFDRTSLFASLLDENGGSWTVELPDARRSSRGYVGDSAVLETCLDSPAGKLMITDWMSVGRDVPRGVLCRRFSAAPADSRITVTPRGDYGKRSCRLRAAGGAVEIDDEYWLYASHALQMEGGAVLFDLRKGEEGWAVLADAALTEAEDVDVERWLSATLEHWRSLSSHASWSGPYEREVAESLRAIRLLTHEETGGIVAAATTSLPEVMGGASNWDYRYVWLRDAGMIVSALVRLGGDLVEGMAYLDFICSSRGSSEEYPLAVFTTLDGEAAPCEKFLELAGYRGSKPVRVGNGAGAQMQLDAFGNVLLAAKLIYQQCEERPHWDTVEQIAEFLAAHWRDPDHGLWEETVKRQYTSSKVIAACALASVADYTSDPAQAQRWRKIVGEIRDFIAARCVTSAGTYAVYAGSEEVDVSTALFPVWAFTDADTPEMLATMAALEKDWSWRGLLYWRRLECADSKQEGAFLAGTFWVAQYWIMRGELLRARRIMDAALAYANDLGLFAEEADPRTGGMLGNLPQAFVHAAFIGAVVDLQAATRNESNGNDMKEEP